MKNQIVDDILKYVEQNIGDFHLKRIKSLNKLSLTSVLKRKNPYLYKAKYVLTADQIIKGLVEAHISSNEETIFGNWLEGLAIFINSRIFGGWKSGISGIDLEFDKNDIRYIVNIKSGPNWGNASQISKMRSDFKTAMKALRSSSSNINVIAVNGCCYGIDNHPDKGDYYKFCGQLFWEFISGDSSLYIDIIQPIGHKAKEKNDAFIESYSQMINKFTLEFGKHFCKYNGSIDWEALVRFNSSHKDT
jgi:hypothetical protein